jgi:hypothetical protein
MTCYQRHLHWLFDALELDYDKHNRRHVDEAIRSVLGIGDEAHCPEVWAAIKGLDDDARLALIPEVQERLP